MSHQFGHLCCIWRKFVKWGIDVRGGGECLGKLSRGGERNVGLPKINFHLLQRNKQLLFVTQSSGS